MKLILHEKRLILFSLMKCNSYPSPNKPRLCYCGDTILRTFFSVLLSHESTLRGSIRCLVSWSKSGFRCLGDRAGERFMWSLHVLLIIKGGPVFASQSTIKVLELRDSPLNAGYMVTVVKYFKNCLTLSLLTN